MGASPPRPGGGMRWNWGQGHPARRRGREILCTVHVHSSPRADKTFALKPESIGYTCDAATGLMESR